MPTKIKNDPNARPESGLGQHSRSVSLDHLKKEQIFFESRAEVIKYSSVAVSMGKKTVDRTQYCTRTVAAEISW